MDGDRGVAPGESVETLDLDRDGRRVGHLTMARPQGSEGSGTSAIDTLRESSFRALLAAELEILALRRTAREDERTWEILRETAERLTTVLEMDAVLQRLAELLRRVVDHQLFSVLLWDDESGRLESAFSRTWDGGCGRRWQAALGVGICGIAARDRASVRVPDVALDDRYVSCGDERARSELAIPLLVKDRLVGVLDLEAHRPDAFSERDQCLLETLASTIAIALDNSRLHEVVQRRERRMAGDLEAARRVHEALLPRKTPWVPGLQIAVTYRAARELGGDLYDILPWGTDRTAFGVGDVAGKGAASALYGALALGALRARASGGDCDPLAVMDHLDQELRQSKVDRRFLAFGFAVFDCGTQILQIANAGLPAPLLVRRGVVEELPLGGLPLGTIAKAERLQIERHLDPGDVLVLTSDGVDEARDAEGRTFGDGPLHELLREVEGLTALQIAEAVVQGANDWAEEITDDLTVLVARVTELCGRC